MPDDPKCVDVPAFESVGDGYGANKEDAFFAARNDCQDNATTFCGLHEGCEGERVCMGELVRLKKVETIPGKAPKAEKVGLRVTYEAKCGCHLNLIVAAATTGAKEQTARRGRRAAKSKASTKPKRRG